MRRAPTPVPRASGSDDNVMDEPSTVAQFLPGPRLDAGIDVPEDGPGALGNEDRHVFFRELQAEEVSVSLFHARPCCEETTTRPGRLHCWSGWLQATLQQTPSTQNVDPHCPALLQAPPIGIGVWVGVAVDVTVEVADGVLVGAAVGLFDGVSDGVPDGIFDGVAVGELAGVSLGVAVLVGVAVGVMAPVFVGVLTGPQSTALAGQRPAS
jgi:hypothetical protein